ncbi:MAG TPA: hypothetical protein VFP93_03865, partial [Gammaproteobacteria bacterium]|nr:hypothetical protein [Gammaproteobacteria bacterium]
LILIGIVNQPAITGLIGSFTPAFQFYNVTQTVNDLGLMGIASFIVLITGALGAMMGAIFGLKR